MSMHPRRPKAEALVNTVDVAERLHDPTDPSTERTAPPCSAHVQHNDVSELLIQLRTRVSPSARQRGDTDDDVTGVGLRLSTTAI